MESNVAQQSGRATRGTETGKGTRRRQVNGSEQPSRERRERPTRRAIPAADAARRAASEVAELTGRVPETVVSIERNESNWHVGVEVVETRRIPDSADVLATYDVELDPGGRLVSYRRLRRYARGQLDRDR
jgi:hypothetical protein